MKNVRNLFAATPKHLSLVEGLVVELDGDKVHGALLSALANSGQAFCFQTLTDQKLIAFDDRMRHDAITFVLDGPGAVTEEIGENSWYFDNQVLYRIVHHDAAKGWFRVVMDHKNPFVNYGVVGENPFVTEEGPAAGDDSSAAKAEAHDQMVIVVQMIGEFLTQTATQYVAWGPKSLQLDALLARLLRVAGATDQEKDQILSAVASMASPLELAQQIAEIAMRRVRGEQ